MSDVGKVGSFGMGEADLCAQIWQMMLDSRSGAFPFHVSTTPSGTPPDGSRVGLVSTFGMGYHDYLLQIWQMMIDARTGAKPLVVTNV